MFGKIFSAVVASNLLLQSFAATEDFHVSHRVTCQKKKVCNGNLMCAYVCEKGTVEVDAWAANSIAFQRQLQRSDKFVYHEMPSTHNSAINEADGFGIEKYFVSALYNGKNEDSGDDLGEGVCQYLTMTDQMRMGIRHLEVDIWYDPRPEVKDIVVCHSPIPLIPFNNITRAAEAANLTLEWDWKNMSCIGTKRMFKDVLQEIYDFATLPENSQDVFLVYFDTKWRLTPEQVTLATNTIKSVFGDLLWYASSGSPLQVTVNDMLAKNKRVIFETNKDCWLTPSEGDMVVFYPTLWTHQFSADSFGEFPDCSVELDYNWYGTQMVRALDGSFIEAATRCGVQFASKDYMNPDDMKLYVWSWDIDEPKSATGCVAMQPNGRWAILDCNENLPYACITSDSKNNGDYKTWSVDLNTVGPFAKAACPSNAEFFAPHNGYANNLLWLQSYGQTLWLNVPNPLATKK